MPKQKTWVAYNGSQATKLDLIDACNELKSALTAAECQYNPRTNVRRLREEMRKLLLEVSEELVRLRAERMTRARIDFSKVGSVKGVADE